MRPDNDSLCFRVTVFVGYHAGDVEFGGVANRPLNGGAAADKSTVGGSPVIGEPIAGGVGGHGGNVVDLDHRISCNKAAEFEI